MNDQKVGTNYAREICGTFREIAEQTELPALKDNLLALAGDLEPIVTKLYFKTQKGTEDMQKMAADMVELKSKLLACQDADQAKTMCDPVCDDLEKVIHHVKTMKVRMT
ncbi:MAG: hypothetical protein LC660_05995 [Desulfobacteraceae bacterium]|nr:hypothetical protein [Desulfobacteraceae bacterium]